MCVCVCVCVCLVLKSIANSMFLAKLQIVGFVAVVWAWPKAEISSLTLAQATAVVTKGVVAQDWYNVFIELCTQSTTYLKAFVKTNLSFLSFFTSFVSTLGSEVLFLNLQPVV